MARAVINALYSDESALSVERLDAAAETTVGKKLGLSKKKIREALDPASIVATRTGTGGAAHESVSEMISECGKRLNENGAWRLETGRKLVEAETRLGMKATLLKIVPSKGESSPEPQRAEPDSLEKEFEDLPKMPPGRRRFPAE